MSEKPLQDPRDDRFMKSGSPDRRGYYEAGDRARGTLPGTGDEARPAGFPTAGPHSGRGPRGYQRPDRSISEDVNEFLMHGHDIDATDVQVEVKDGVVTLRGRVADRFTKRMAEVVASGVRGVKDVMNELKVGRAAH
jgi:hypothetical protein